MSINKTIFILFVSLVTFFPNMVYSQIQNFMKEQPRNRLLIQTIGIKYKNNTNLSDLQTVADLSKYIKNGIAKDRLFPCYKNSGKVLQSLDGINITVDSVLNCLHNLAVEAKSTDVVILHIVGHGKCDSDGIYYFLCSDGGELEGGKILDYIKKITSSGTLVIIFLDTCNSGALFEENENDSFLSDDKGGIAFFASSQRNQSSRETGQSTKFTKTILETFEKGEPLAVGALAKTIYKAFEKVDSTKQKPDTLFLPNRRTLEGYKIQDYPIIRERYTKSKPINNNKAFLPWTISPKNGKGLDYTLIGVECASFIGMVVCGPVLQSKYQNKIDNSTNPWERNDYRKKGKNAAIGFCVSTGLLVSSYLGRALHVRHQISLKNMENQRGGTQSVTLDVLPTFSPDNNGLSLVLNF